MEDPKILIVDDTKINRIILKRFLNELDYQADELDAGEKAIEACINGTYDIVFMDLQMPDMSGIVATERILKNNANIKTNFIAVSAFSLEKMIAQCSHVGFADFLPKPFGLKDIKSLVERNI